MRATGGCMCGAVRFEIKSAPFDCGWCHCRTCQLISGAPAMAFGTANVEDFGWTAGADKLRTLRSSSFGQRSFCSECGTPLLIQVDYQPDTLDFPIATLDEPNGVQPEFHIFWGSKVSWFNPHDELPKFDRFRPNTRGLVGTEPPK